MRSTYARSAKTSLCPIVVSGGGKIALDRTSRLRLPFHRSESSHCTDPSPVSFTLVHVIPRHPLLQLVAPQEFEQIPERPTLHDQCAVHIKFAEIAVRMQRELQRRERALEAYGHIRTRLCCCQFAELFRVAVGSNDC